MDAGLSNANTFEQARTQLRSDGKRRHRRRLTDSSSMSYTFMDGYRFTGEVLGEGACACVKTALSLNSGLEVAVKVIEKYPGYPRAQVFKEIDIFHLCRHHSNIIQLLEYWEEDEAFYLVFEKVCGGQLLDRIRERQTFTEIEASLIIRDLASGLQFLHSKGIAHRDLKPENILCVNTHTLTPVKICDFDLGSGIQFTPNANEQMAITTPLLRTPVGSADFMAPEVIDVFFQDLENHINSGQNEFEEEDDEFFNGGSQFEDPGRDNCGRTRSFGRGGSTVHYDKRCDLWSLGVIMHVLLCGYPPFNGYCGGPCGWHRGEVCFKCRDLLFQNIRRGEFEFDDAHWSHVSQQAKDLIRQLLCKDPFERPSADAVFNNDWVQQRHWSQTSAATAEVTEAGTPQVKVRANTSDVTLHTPLLMRRMSGNLHQLSLCAQSMMALNRTIMHHGLSVSENRARRSKVAGKQSSDHDHESSTALREGLGLSPPLESSLLRRRMLMASFCSGHESNSSTLLSA